MNKTTFRVPFWLVTLFLCLVTACGGGSTTTPPTNPGAPTIDSFTATPATINQGGTSTLAWTLSGAAATSVTINNGVTIPAGAINVTVSPATTTTYTLTATNTAGSNTKTATVTVNALPVDEASAKLSGTLTGNKVMRTGKVYVIEADVTVPKGSTLAIEPGAIIKFDTNCCRRYNLIIEGSLTVNGSEGSRVYFTSLRDDTIGNDTNGDGGASTPGAGNWGSIVFRNGGTGRVQYTELRYGESTFYTDGSSPTFDNISVRDASYSAFNVAPSDSPTITNFEVQRTPYGGVAVRPGAMNQNVTWNQTAAPFILTDNVTATANLTIESGVIVKFDTDCCRRFSLIIEGLLTVNGTADKPVYFTSIRDDTIGGDTNGNGGASVPGAGNWGNVLFRNGGSGNLKHAEIRYAYNSIYTDGSSPTFDSIVVRDAGYSAFDIATSDSPTITNLTTLRTPYRGVVVRPGAITQNVTWSQTAAPFILTDNVTVTANLTLAPGVILKFDTNCCRRFSLIIEGSLTINGVAGNPVYFTSIRDDTIGGDTNNDAGASAPADGNWETILFQSGSTATPGVNEIRYARVAPTFP